MHSTDTVIINNKNEMRNWKKVFLKHKTSLCLLLYGWLDFLFIKWLQQIFGLIIVFVSFIPLSIGFGPTSLFLYCMLSSLSDDS